MNRILQASLLYGERKRKILHYLIVEECIGESGTEAPDFATPTASNAVAARATTSGNTRSVHRHMRSRSNAFDPPEYVIPFPVDDFRATFRMTRESFEELIKLTKPSQRMGAGKRPIQWEYQVLLFLRYLGSQDPLDSLSSSFNVTLSTVHQTIRRVCAAFVPKLSSEMIRWPDDYQKEKVSSDFALLSKGKFPAIVIGALDCREIKILMPLEHPEAYLNRKHFYSVKLQAVVDASRAYTDVFVGWPGKSTDSRAFVHSSLYEKLENSPDQYRFALVADSSYPLKKYLMTPFTNYGHLSAERQAYNYYLTKLRSAVTCAFGTTIERWQRLKFMYLHKIDDCATMITAACALHNYCLLRGEQPFEFDSEEYFSDDIVVDEFHERGSSAGSVEAKLVRDHVVQCINANVDEEVDDGEGI